MALGGAAIAPMFIKGPDGKPLMTLESWIPKDAVTLVDKVSDLTNNAPIAAGSSASGKQTFYKWKDEDGVWQMTQYKPTHLTDAEIDERTIYANANIIQSLNSDQISKVTQPKTQSSNTKKFAYNPTAPKDMLADEGDAGEKDESGFSLTTVSMKKIPELLNQAQSIDANTQKRMEAINQHSR